MEIPRHWRLQRQRYTLTGEICPNCDIKIFPDRDVCPDCGTETKSGKRVVNVVSIEGKTGKIYVSEQILEQNQQVED
jgi:uncharacterized OB-fold protein